MNGVPIVRRVPHRKEKHVLKNVTVSDRTGKPIEDKDKAVVVVRNHPDIITAKRIDVHKYELTELRCISDEVRLEITRPDGSVEHLSCTAQEFEEFFGSNKLQSAPSNRGRQPGFRPSLTRAR